MAHKYYYQYRVSDCPTCEGSGMVSVPEANEAPYHYRGTFFRVCPDCARKESLEDYATIRVAEITRLIKLAQRHDPRYKDPVFMMDHPLAVEYRALLKEVWTSRNLEVNPPEWLQEGA